MTVPVPEFSGCVWPVDSACLTEEWSAFSAEVQDRALALASASLQRLTGNRVSNCPVTVRPCKPGSHAMAWHPYLTPVGSYGYHPQIDQNGRWINSCGHGTCSCTTACEVHLPAPVGRVDEVRVDGVVLDPSEYRVDSKSLLVWQGEGDCPWPATQDLSKSDTEQGTFSITYLNAYPPDRLAAYAAGVLAMEFAKACAGGRCRLPSGVQTISRQGVTMEVVSGAFPDGMTGIREVDAFIALWNPSGLQRQATVWSPDMAKHRTTRGAP